MADTAAIGQYVRSMGRPDKREVFLSLMEQGWVSICLDARKSGVDLPEYLRKEPRLVLQYGFNMPVPITDLDIGQDGIRATLSFERVPYYTFVPWSAVYIIMPTDSDRPGILYAEDIPTELTASLQHQAKGYNQAGQPETSTVPRGGRGTTVRPDARTGQASTDKHVANRASADAGVRLTLVPEDTVLEPAQSTCPRGDVPKPRRRSRKPALKLVK